MRLSTLFLGIMVCIAVSESTCKAMSACEETAATNYAIAIAIDDPNADMVHENSMADCEEPLTYAQAMAVAGDSACYIEQYADGWIVRESCDE